MLTVLSLNPSKRRGIRKVFCLFALPSLCVSYALGQQPDQPDTERIRPRTVAAIEPTVVAYRDYQDPLMPFNRAMFAFNDLTFRTVWIPLGKGYVNAVPKPVRTGVGQVFANLKLPISAVNHLLQLKPKRAGQNLGRFVINSTVGLAGIFDPAASEFEMKNLDTDFEDTLAHYGANYGAYLVLPLVGPTDMRRGTGTIVDYFLHPVTYLAENPESTLINGFDSFQKFAPAGGNYLKLQAESGEPYLFFRNLYLQGVQRDADYEKKAN